MRVQVCYLPSCNHVLSAQHFIFVSSLGLLKFPLNRLYYPQLSDGKPRLREAIRNFPKLLLPVIAEPGFKPRSWNCIATALFHFALSCLREYRVMRWTVATSSCSWGVEKHPEDKNGCISPSFSMIVLIFHAFIFNHFEKSRAACI